MFSSFAAEVYKAYKALSEQYHIINEMKARGQ